VFVEAGHTPNSIAFVVRRLHSSSGAGGPHSTLTRVSPGAGSLRCQRQQDNCRFYRTRSGNSSGISQVSLLCRYSVVTDAGAAHWRNVFLDVHIFPPACFCEVGPLIILFGTRPLFYFIERLGFSFENPFLHAIYFELECAS
jgi:hypothetical protein